MLPPLIQSDILHIVATDRALRHAILSALFHGSDRSTDIYEAFTSYNINSETDFILFHKEYPDYPLDNLPETNDDEEDQDDDGPEETTKGLYSLGNNVAVALIDAVENYFINQ